MSVAQVAFDIPPAIQAGIDAGTLIRYGGVVRDTAGHIVKHLKEIPIPRQANQAAKAVPVAAKNVGVGTKIMNFAKKNKYLLIGAVIVTAIVGGVTYFVVKNKKGEDEAVTIPQCVIDFNTSLMAYINAIRNSKVTEDAIDKVLSALQTIKDNQDKGVLDGDFSYENAELLIKMIKDYTEKLVQANNLEMPSDIEIKNDKIIDLQTYLNIQKQVFATAQ